MFTFVWVAFVISALHLFQVSVSTQLIWFDVCGQMISDLSIPSSSEVPIALCWTATTYQTSVWWAWHQQPTRCVHKGSTAGRPHWSAPISSAPLHHPPFEDMLHALLLHWVQWNYVLMYYTTISIFQTNHVFKNMIFPFLLYFIS